jgi:hypothetical protein
MIITDKHLMRDFDRLSVVFKHDKAFMEKVAACAMPTHINGVKLKVGGEIPLQYIAMCWNVQDEAMLKRITALGYGLDAEKIAKYPLIDFLRMTQEFQSEAEKAAKMFMTLKRESKDERLKSILKDFKTSERAIYTEIMISSNGAYTQEQAADMPWILAYDIIERNTMEYDKQMAINEIQQEDMKHGRK